MLFLPSAHARDIKFSAEGDWNSFYGYTFPDHDYKHRDKRQSFINTFELNFGAEKIFTDDWSLGLYTDLFAAINKRQRNYSNGLWGHEIYGILDNPYGRFMFGETQNVVAQFHIGAPKVGKFGLNDGLVIDFLANPNWIKEKHKAAYRTLNSTAVNTDGTAAKISYITPDYHDLTFGFTYVPDTYSRTGLVQKGAKYARDDGYIGAAYYTADLGFAELETSLGYAVFHKNDKELSIGASLYRAGWTLGGSWRKADVEGNSYPITKISQNRKLPDLFDNYREGEAWDVGIGYEFGPVKTALSYFESKATNTSNKDKIWLLSNEFRYNKHLAFYLATAKVDFEGLTHQESNRGWATMTGFSLSF